MEEHKLSFANENLVVDYISFNISGLRDAEPIANYLFNFGFNSVLKSNAKTKGDILISDNRNYYSVTFVKSKYDPVSKSYWDRVVVRFSGTNGHYFYELIQKKVIDWDIFDLSSTRLGRLDINFLRDVSDAESREELGLFMGNSCKKVKVNCRKTYAEYFVKNKGLLLEIGSRGSNHRLRVYEKKKSLKFELEIKKVTIQSYQGFLFSYNLEEFEDKLVKHYYKQLKKWLALDSFYIDWLLARLRKINSLESDQRSLLEKPENRLNHLVSSYLYGNTLNFLVQKEQFFQLLQFFSFLRTLDSSRQFLDDQVYCIVEFALMDFISFTWNNPTSSYQRNKALKFFVSLQDIKPLIQKFSDNEFRRSVMFPYLKLNKKNRGWTVKMAIGEELYFYPYPFSFPVDFLVWKNKYDLLMKLQLIESLSTVSLEKKFPLKNFLNQFSVSNKDLTKIKKQLIELFSELKDSELIEDRICLDNDSDIDIKNCMPVMLSKNKYIYFWEKV